MEKLKYVYSLVKCDKMVFSDLQSESLKHLEVWWLLLMTVIGNSKTASYISSLLTFEQNV